MITALAPELRVVLAPNPGPMTGPGTNQYLVGGPDAILIDVASFDTENRRRLGAAEVRPARLLLTHIHPDHLGGALALRAATGAPIALHQSRRQFIVGGEPLAPDAILADGDEIAYAGGRLRVVHTPGHESGHCCYHDPDRRWLFTGDTILGTGTTVIAPPDGNMAAYLDTLRRLLTLDLARILPGHGPPIDRPYEKITEYIEHRLMRERQIMDALASGIDAVPAVVARLYADVPAVLHWAAALTVRAHLEKLIADGAVVEEPGDRFRVR